MTSSRHKCLSLNDRWCYEDLRRQTREGRVFFFFYSPGTSAAYEDPVFKQFCRACFELRKIYPNLTASTCRTLLTVLSQDGDTDLTYEEIADLAGLEYIQVAHHIEMLSSGRGGEGGLALLSRVEASDRRLRRVILTDRGLAFGRAFLLQKDELADRQTIARHIVKSTLPGFRTAVECLPGISLGTLAVLLSIATQQTVFGFSGEPAKIVADQLGISNFPRHLAMLADGMRDRPGYGLVQMTPSRRDKRVKLPELTAEGHRVVSVIAAAVLGKTRIDPPRKVRPDVLDGLEGPEQVSTLSETEYEWIIDEDGVKLPDHHDP